MKKKISIHQLKKYLDNSKKTPFSTKNYPSRGQTAIQEIYQSEQGKFFLKKTSRRNHQDCQISPKAGSIAEREYWAFCLAERIKISTPQLWHLDRNTTVQRWLDIPDARLFATSYGKLILRADNVFDCALFDWLTGQVDRHDANYLYDFIRQQIILIDSAHCFLKYDGSIPDYLKYFEIGFSKELKKTLDTPVKNNIQKLSMRTLHRTVPLRDPLERQTFEKRWQQLGAVHRIQDIIDLYRGER